MRRRTAIIAAAAAFLATFAHPAFPAARKANSLAGLRTTPTITRSMRSVVPQLAANGIYQAPPLPDTLRVLAIRVDFEPDTLSTTTGDGSFFYNYPEDVDPEDWIVDPPPHDSTYFADQLLAMKNYYQRFSHGKLTLTGLEHDGPMSGGDIYPRGGHAAYRIPYPIWHVNYGDGDDDRLNRTLTELFVDAWSIADSVEGFNVQNYDVFIIFHAGAGNEFDTGFDTTPHDIPSVVIGLQDLGEYTGRPDGLRMRNGNYITRGAILPETQRQDNIDVGMMGTVCAQVGFLIGMPHLYDTETGDPGIGLFGLMDRGFGGFFGLDPTPPSAWMRAYMGWETVTTISEGAVRVGALHLADSVFTADTTLHRLVRVPINDSEYYLLEARRRDPDEDSLTVAFDRHGNRLILHDDYTMEPDPSNTGTFGVPIRVEDHDFDLPASGMLIWHIDDSVIRAKIADDKLQTDRDHRGVSLMEADGTKDIGEDYAFLQAGDGSEYGVREDAWYVDNDLWKEANGLSTVILGTNTAPASVANNGGQTHIAITGFSAIGDTMSATVLNTWKQGDFPRELPWVEGDSLQTVFADLDGDSAKDLVVYGSDGVVRAWKGVDGSPLGLADGIFTQPAGQRPAILMAAPKTLHETDNDARDVLVLVYDGGANVLTYEPAVQAAVNETIPVDAHNPIDAMMMLPPSGVSPGGDLDHPRIAVLHHESGSGIRFSISTPTTNEAPVIYDLTQISDGFTPDATAKLVSLTTWGHASRGLSVEIAIVSSKGNMITFQLAPVEDPFRAQPAPEGLHPGETVDQVVGVGGVPPKLAALTSEGRLVRWTRIELSYDYDVSIETLDHPLTNLRPADIDKDGRIEYTGMAANSFTGVEPGGIWSEGSPVPLLPSLGTLEGEPLLMDISGDGALDLVFVGRSSNDNVYISAFDVITERPCPGFPLDFGYSSGDPLPTLYAGQLDTDPDIEIAAVMPPSAGSPAQLAVYNLPRRADNTPEVYWGAPERDAARTRRVPGNLYPPFVRNDVIDISNAYAWPNPVYDGTVHFRFKATMDGKANLRVYDVTGRKLADLEQSFKGSDQEEQEVALNVADWPSGVYVARFEAGGEHKMIRFAVVQ